jgi:hypothetical protein
MKATHTLPILDIDTGMTSAQLLRGAALYIQRHGWIIGEFFDLLSDEQFPPACSIGAINIAAHGRPILCSDDQADDTNTDAAIKAVRVFASFLDSEYGQPGNDTSAIDIVSDWNDGNDRTVDEVIDMLREAADDWDRTHTTGGTR